MGCGSLRELTDMTSAYAKKSKHLGFGHQTINRQILSKANTLREHRIFEEFAFHTVSIAQFRRITKEFELHDRFYAIDSTTIDLCMSVSRWAEFRSTKLGIRIYAQIDIVTEIPVFYRVRNTFCLLTPKFFSEMNIKKTLVSVIIPNFNHSRFLDERIHSILNQTYTNYEIIILDDCSTDNSREIIEHYRNLHCISNIVYNSTNSGSPFKQWEKGFEYAKGELIWIAESDDSCSPDFLQEIINSFAKYGNKCVVCYTKSVKIDTNRNPLSEVGLSKDSYYDGRFFIKKYLSKANYISNASGVVFRRKVLCNVDSSFMTYRGCGDWVFWIEVCKNGNIAYINKPLNFFRQHSMSTTSQLFESGGTEIENIRIFNHMRDKGYIGIKEILHTKITHIYSLRYGKQHGYFPKEMENDYIQQWGDNIIVTCVIWAIHILQKSGLHVINR